MLSRITVAQVGRQNEATVGFGDNTCGSILLPKPIGSRTRPRAFQSSGVIFKPAPRAGVTPNRPFYRRGYPVSPYSYPPIPLIPPYASACYLPSSVVITSPYLCILHNEAFVSRIGMIDHLARMHGMLLDAAASICPDAAANCIFPSY